MHDASCQTVRNRPKRLNINNLVERVQILISQLFIMGSTSNNYVEKSHSEPRRLKVVHVGAGAAGLMMAYKAKNMLSNYELTVYEK